ncbi:hypothetical protein X975_14395, partial [Stegodyphus mimosarum]
MTAPRDNTFNYYYYYYFILFFGYFFFLASHLNDHPTPVTADLRKGLIAFSKRNRIKQNLQHILLVMNTVVHT